MFVDLTLQLAADNPVFKKAISPEKSPLLAMGHVGTHLDTLLHRPIPLTHMNRRGICIDLADGADLAGPEVLEGRKIAEGDFVIFRTGHLARHGYGAEGYFRGWTELDLSLVDSLLQHMVSFIGIDAQGLRRAGPEHAKVDRLCEENGTWVIENLNHLEMLPDDRRFSVQLGWIAHTGMTGIPVHVVASI